MASFGENLKRIRLERRMTQDEMAEKLHTAKQVISRYENDQRVPRADVVARFARTLNVPIERLLSDKYADFADRLSVIMSHRSLSLREVEEKTGISSRDLGRMLAGDLVPDVEQFESLRRLLNVTTECLNGETEADIVEPSISQKNTDDDVWAEREALRRDPDRRALLDLARHGPAKSVRQVAALIDALKATNPDFYDGDDPA